MTEMRPATKAVVFMLCLVFLFWTLGPIYWAITTSFKTPIAVNGGPTYIPFVDYQPTLDAWRAAFSGQRGDFLATFLNSSWIALSATALSVALGAMAAYALVRFPFRVYLLSGLIFSLAGIGGYLGLTAYLGMREMPAMGLAFLLALAVAVPLNWLPRFGPRLGNDDVVFWFISQRMMPPIVSAFALYLLYSRMGREGLTLLDSYWGLVLCYTAFSLPIVVWLLRDFFQSLPVEVEEAALVDDVPRWRIFVQIVIPMTLPGLVAVALITLGFIWNEFLFALILTTGDWQTLPVLLAGQNSYRGDEWWAISVAVVIAIAPMMIVTLFLARLMRSGMMLGSIK